MKQRRANEAKNMGPAQSAAEAFGQMCNKKRQLQSLKSKVNFDRLGELFNELEKTDDPKKEKKARFDPPPDNHDNLQLFEHKNDDEMGSVNEFEDDMGEYHQSGLSTDNIADIYFPEDDGYGYKDYDY